MRLTARPVFDFGEHRNLVGDDLVRPESWDALRVGTEGPVSLACQGRLKSGPVAPVEKWTTW